MKKRKRKHDNRSKICEKAQVIGGMPWETLTS
jgi:hypothetical protein